MANDVDRYVTALGDDWQRETCGRLLDDIRAAAALTEHIKWGHPYFELGGAGVLKWFCAKDWITVFLYRGRGLEDPHGLFEPSQNARMLAIRITRGRELDRGAFRNLVRAATTLAVR